MLYNHPVDEPFHHIGGELLYSIDSGSLTLEILTDAGWIPSKDREGKVLVLTGSGTQYLPPQKYRFTGVGTVFLSLRQSQAPTTEPMGVFPLNLV